MNGRLRLRMALFFAALAGLSMLAVGLGGAVAVHAEGVDPVDLVGAGAVAVFGIAIAAALIALLFDENVARPIDQLSAALRARAHGNVTAPLDQRSAKYLSDLAPSAAALADRLCELDHDIETRVEKATQDLAAQREQLAAILSEMPIAALVLDEDFRITLYDRQCVHVLGGVAALALGRSVFRYLDEAALRDVVKRLDSTPEHRVVRVDLPTADGKHIVNTRVRRVGEAQGAVLVMEVEEEVMAERPLVFDFALMNRPKRGGASLDLPLAALPFVVFDTETTGLEPAKDEVVQIGAVRLLNSRFVSGETYDTLVHPGRAIPAASSRIHGITDDMVRCAPAPCEAISDFHDLARGETLVAHNAPLDLAFLARHAERGGYCFDAPVLATVLLSAALYGEAETHTLDAIAERLGVEIEGIDRHTAMGDAVATARVLLHMIPMLSARGVVTLGDAIEAMRQHQRMMPTSKALFVNVAA